MEGVCYTLGSHCAMERCGMMGLGKASCSSWWCLPWMAEEERISGVSQEFNWWKMQLPVAGRLDLFRTKYLWKITASCVRPVFVSVSPMMIPMYHPPFAKHLFTDHKAYKKNCCSASLWFHINSMMQRRLSNSMWTMKAIPHLWTFQVEHKW